MRQAVVALTGKADWEQAGSTLGLAPQQSRAIALIAEGKPDKQILAQLEISYGTLRTYLSRAFERLGVSGRTELALKVQARVIELRQQKLEGGAS